MPRRNHTEGRSARKPIFGKRTAEIIKLPAAKEKPTKIKDLAGLKDILLKANTETTKADTKPKVETITVKPEVKAETPTKPFRFNKTEKKVKEAVELILDTKIAPAPENPTITVVPPKKETKAKTKPTETIKQTRAKAKPAETIAETAKKPIMVSSEAKPQTSKPEPKVKAKKLPHIDDLFTLFQTHQSKMAQAINNAKWGDISKLQNKFKSDMEAMGIAEHFDWTETEEKKVIRNKMDRLANPKK